MTKNLVWKILSSVILTALMALYVIPFEPGYKLFNLITLPSVFTNSTYKLGLDLKGGSQLVYNVDLKDVPAERENDILNGVEEVIRRRIDGLGVTEPLIQSSSVGEKKNIIVELPGIQNIEEAVAIVGKVVQLQFKEQKTELTDKEKEDIKKKNEESKLKAEELFKTITDENKTNLKDVSTTSKDGYYTNVDKETDLSSLAEGIQSEINSWEEFGENKIYPNLIETADNYTIFKVNKTSSTKEKEISTSHILISYKGAQRASEDIVRTEEEALTLAKEIKGKLDSGEDFVKLSTDYSDDTVSKENEGILEEPIKESVSPYDPDFTKAALQLSKDQVSEPVKTPFGYHIIKARDIKEIDIKKLTYETIDFKKESEVATGWQDTGVTGEHFDFASANFDPNTLAPLVNIQFNAKGKDLFAAITEKNLNKPLAIFLDDKPIIGEEVYAPTVQSKITDGSAVITGLRSLEEASILAQNLNTGAIPAPIKLIGESTIGATLGMEALQVGLKAGLIGVILLSIFMVLYYRLSGIIAVLALVSYGVMLAGVIKIIGVTLTLAGIAGIILSIGIAVDANILVFERMKEEINLGKNLRLALNEGFDRAWNSIRDSNFSGLITCAVLFIFGSGIIRGFALTLSLGIIISMISALYITKYYMKGIISIDKLADKPYIFLPFTNTKK